MKVVDVIKYEGDNDTFVWKHPAEDFNTMSQLIVHEAQEAILFRDGQALDLFGPGRYTLKTENIPLLRKVVNMPTDGVSPFHCEVYFINKTMPLDMKWGTRSQVVVLDPKFSILLHAGANGGMGVQISDSRSFLTKFVGTTNSFDKEGLINYFREMIETHVKTYLTNVMSQVSFITVNTKLDDMSIAMQEALSDEVTTFGVKLIKFYISSIQLDKDDYEKIQIALANAGAMKITASAEKNRMEILGYTWAEQEMSEIMKTYAANEGSAENVAGIMTQMPMAMAFGQMLRDNVSAGGFANAMAGFSAKEDVDVNFCINCGRKLEAKVNFCPGCGKEFENGINCKRCGKSLKEDEKFCSNCGMKKE